MQILAEPEDSMAFVESDDRFQELRDAMMKLRGFDPHEDMSRVEYNAMKKASQTFAHTISGLEADYDVPADAIRTHILGMLRDSDN
jgi:hypothetical protein